MARWSKSSLKCKPILSHHLIVPTAHPSTPRLGQKSDPEIKGVAPIIPKKTPKTNPGKPTSKKPLGVGPGVTKPTGRKPPLKTDDQNPLILKAKPGTTNPKSVGKATSKPAGKVTPRPAGKVPLKPAGRTSATHQKKKGGKRKTFKREAIAEAYADTYAEIYDNTFMAIEGLSRRDAEAYAEAYPYPYSFADPYAEPVSEPELELEGLYMRKAMPIPSYIY